MAKGMRAMSKAKAQPKAKAKAMARRPAAKAMARRPAMAMAKAMAMKKAKPEPSFMNISGEITRVYNAPDASKVWLCFDKEQQKAAWKREAIKIIRVDDK